MAKKFTFEEHVKKHCMRENTYNSECKFCNPDRAGGINDGLTEVEKRIKRRLGY